MSMVDIFQSDIDKMSDKELVETLESEEEYYYMGHSNYPKIIFNNIAILEQEKIKRNIP